jgi:hypothetical protein
MLPDTPSAPAHCATLCARVLRRSLSEQRVLRHCAAYYGPSTLFNELNSVAAAQALHARARAIFEPATLDTHHTAVLSRLTRGSLQQLRGLTDDECDVVTRHLAQRVVQTRLAGIDATALQRELAVGLFRWSQIVRKGS